MAREDEARPADNPFIHFFDWMDEKLRPAFGPPPVTEYGGPDRPVDRLPCPVCGEVMAKHEIDRSTDNPVLICPTAEQLPLPADVPLGELGMPASDDRLEKLSRRE